MTALARKDTTDLASPPPAPRERTRMTVAAPAVAAPAGARPAKRWRPTWAHAGFAATAALLVFGYWFPTEQYITPQSGAGYALGIVGGSAMLVLLLYPARKRWRWLGFIGTTKRWFQAHMVLGVVGPLLVLYHSNFSLGASNSNVALACMLTVAGSGLFGRYFYARIHHGLHGRVATLAELRDYAEKLRWVTTHVDFLPGLVDRIDAEEQAMRSACDRVPLLARPALGAFTAWRARGRLHRHVRLALAATDGTPAAARRRDLLQTACDYVDERIAATRRVVEFAAFERLFSLWHAFHMPLFVMLLVAGLVHVVAVHVY